MKPFMYRSMVILTRFKGASKFDTIIDVAICLCERKKIDERHDRCDTDLCWADDFKFVLHCEF